MVNNATIEQFNNEAFTTMQQSNNNLLQVNPSAEKSRITSFIKTVLQKTGFQNVVIGLSGGLDSTTSFYLLKEAVFPQNIFIAHLYYFDSQLKDIEPILKQSGVPKENIYNLSIKPFVKTFQTHLRGVPQAQHHLGGGRLRSHDSSEVIGTSSEANRIRSKLHLEGGQMDSFEVERVRLGNIMARVRMIILYDLSKKHNALVCGTENKSEYLLGYFTRFGDAASDFEPIQHLYKTQVYQLASSLGVPKNIIKKTPTAGLWHGQTDEGEFGFSYKEADEVLFYYYDKKLKLEEIKNKGFKNAEKIIKFSLKNSYKHHAPYTLTL